MKKILSIVFLFLLTACGNINQKDLYKITIGGKSIVVGYDDSSVIDDNIDSYTTTMKDDKEILNKIVVYINDIDNDILIDDIKITDSIAQTCTLLNGEFSNAYNGEVCLVAKRIKKHDNYVLIYSDILNDDLDKTDRVEIYFD